MNIVINFLFELYFLPTAELILRQYNLYFLGSVFSQDLFSLAFDNDDNSNL